MRQILLIALLFYSFKISAQNNFDEGFKDGFKNGYCYSTKSNIYCNPPLPAITPLPQINENRNSYQDGYNRGFIFGRNKRNKVDNNISNNNNSSSYPLFNDYVSQNPVALMSQVGISRQILYNRRTQWIQERINGLTDLIIKLYNQETFPNMAISATRELYRDKIVAYTSTYAFMKSDFADDYQFKIAVKNFQNIENSIFKSYNSTLQSERELAREKIEISRDETKFRNKYKGMYCASFDKFSVVNNKWLKTSSGSGFIDFNEDGIIFLDDYKCGDEVALSIDEDGYIVNSFLLGEGIYDDKNDFFSYLSNDVIIKIDFSYIEIYEDDKKKCISFKVDLKSKLK